MVSYRLCFENNSISRMAADMCCVIHLAKIPIFIFGDKIGVCSFFAIYDKHVTISVSVCNVYCLLVIIRLTTS